VPAVGMSSIGTFGGRAALASALPQASAG